MSPTRPLPCERVVEQSRREQRWWWCVASGGLEERAGMQPASASQASSLEWPVRETSRQRLIACFASSNVEARDMRMGVAWQGPPPHTDCPFIRDIAVPVPRFILMAVDISHYMQACMHTCSITHVGLASRIIACHHHHDIYVVLTNMLEQSVYTRPPLSWPNPAPVNQTTADNLLPPLLLPLAPGTPAFARQ